MATSDKPLNVEQRPAPKNTRLEPVRGAYLASIAHGPGDSRLGLTDLRNGETTIVPAGDAPLAYPVWAPDASHVLFSAGDALMSYDIAEKQVDRIETGLTSTGRTPFAYSQDGRLAFARQRFVHVEAPPGALREEPRRYPLPARTSFVQLIWGGHGRTLFVLTRSDDDDTRASLMAIDTGTRGTSVRQVGNITALLGWDPTRSGPVVVRSRPELIGNEAVVVLASGELRTLRDAEENDSGEFVIAYRSDTHETVAVLGRDDLGDPVRLLILPPGKGAARPWLQAFPHLDDLSIAADGRCVFVDRSENEATIYFVPFGSEEATPVVKSHNGYTFGTPVLSP